MKLNLKVTIITAVRNNKDFIETAINSVLTQSYPMIEYIIIDGASTDGTKDVIRKYEKKISEWISEPDNGIYEALNKGLKLATGDVVGLLHSDDLFANNYVIEKIAGKFVTDNADGVYSDLVYVSKSDINKIIRYWRAGKYSSKSLNYGWMPPHPALFARRSLYEKTGLFDTGLKIASDYDIVLRLLKNCSNSVSYIDEVMVKMRLGGKSNVSMKNIIRKSSEDYKVLNKNNFPLPAMTLFLKNIRKINQFFYK